VRRGGPTRRGRRGAAFSQRGVALIAVSTALSIIMAILVEFGTNTTVDTLSAANARDQMRAEFLTRSGLNLARLVIRVQTDLVDPNKNVVGDIQLGDYLGMFMGAFGGSQEEVAAFGEMLGGFGGDALASLGSEGGTFDLQLGTEDGKINMNCAGGIRSREEQRLVEQQLVALFAFDAYNPLFEQPDAQGWQRDRATQIAALIDYLDAGSQRYGATGPEDHGYENLDDAYKPKDTYLDTVGELKLARGVDDRFWTLFGGNFTVYGGCKVNIREVDDPRMFAALIMLSADENDPALRDQNRVWQLAQQAAGARELGVVFDKLDDFIEYIKNPFGAVADLYSQQGLAPPPEAAAAAGGQNLGIELKADKLAEIAGEGNRRTYRVEVTAEVPRGQLTDWTLRRKVTAVWDTKLSAQNARNADERQGGWVFYQEE
jgi:type II secretory pathway component PulK